MHDTEKNTLNVILLESERSHVCVVLFMMIHRWAIVKEFFILARDSPPVNSN